MADDADAAACAGKGGMKKEGLKQGLKQQSVHLSIIVKDQNGTEVHFKIKPSTKFAKVFDAYCDKKSLQSDTVKFIFDGTRVRPSQTPEEIEMMDGDNLDAVIHQLGGCY